ncbi:hypothetical protein OUK_0424 [Helicobacter pylori R037c]|nr:hypothetical protein OUK_0424 [Helicobacter pylori R037c]
MLFDNPPNSLRREQLETNLMGAMVGLEARERARSLFFNLTLFSGWRNP